MNRFFFYIQTLHKSFLESEPFRILVLVLGLVIVLLTVFLFTVVGSYLLNKQLYILEKEVENTRTIGKALEVILDSTKPKQTTNKPDTIRLKIKDL